jgi:hypothetical protein
MLDIIIFSKNNESDLKSRSLSSMNEMNRTRILEKDKLFFCFVLLSYFFLLIGSYISQPI